MQPSQPVTVLFFARAREAAGRSRATFDDAAGRPLHELVQRLPTMYGMDVAPVLASCAIWVNGLPSSVEQVLHPGDEVAVLPPVSGG